MENVCDVNQLNDDVLLPPRKRLLAGLKKQSPDGFAMASPSPVAVSCVMNVASPSSSSFPSEFETRLKHLFSCNANNRNFTPVEVVEASKTAALAASKAAKAARAAAEEKAAIAAKAVAAAKNALELVASFSAVSKEGNMKKNKSKKHLPVQLFYKKYHPVEHCGEDEELARKLHRVMNSSARISKNSPNSDSRRSKCKKLKGCLSLEITEGSDAGIAFGQESLSLNNGHAIAGKIDSDGSIQEASSSKNDKKGSKYDRSSSTEIENGEAESIRSKEKNSEDLSPTCKKRGRVKLKKLPLSICSSKDRAQSKEETKAISSQSTKIDTENHPVDIPSFPPAASSAERVIPIEATSMWKCQEYTAPVCIKQNKVVQS